MDFSRSYRLLAALYPKSNLLCRSATAKQNKADAGNPSLAFFVESIFISSWLPDPRR